MKFWYRTMFVVCLLNNYLVASLYSPREGLHSGNLKFLPSCEVVSVLILMSLSKFSKRSNIWNFWAKFHLKFIWFVCVFWQPVLHLYICFWYFHFYTHTHFLNLNVLCTWSWPHSFGPFVANNKRLFDRPFFCRRCRCIFLTSLILSFHRDPITFFEL